MRIPRLFHSGILNQNESVSLNLDAAHYLTRVLRLHLNAPVILFNGQGGAYQGVITEINKTCTLVTLSNFIDNETESPLPIHLAQVISRGERMDWVIQKATELGVSKITPLFSERCEVKLDAQRSAKKQAHWQKIITSACEQSGRNRLPELLPETDLLTWISELKEEQKFLLAPTATTKLKSLSISGEKGVCLLIGAEGGLSEREITFAIEHGFQAIQLGPRILRTETAPLAIISAMQTLYGDF